MPPSTERAEMGTSAPALEQTAIHTLVHKRFHENVLLTEIRAGGDDHFLCAGRIPAAHPFFTDGARTPRQDILFYTEAGRQASLAVCHAFLNVGFDDVFIFENSQALLTDGIWRSPSQPPPESVAIEIKVRDIGRRKNGAVNRVVAEHSMFVGNEPVFTGTGTWTIQSAALFKRLRKASAPVETFDSSTVAPLLVINNRYSGLSGRQPDNVVIQEPEYISDKSALVADLIVDRTHRYFFDHACDHVPGMLLLEGCAQLAAAACAECGMAPAHGAVLTAYDVIFTQFVECSTPTTLSARVSDAHDTGRRAGSPTVEIVISQQDVVSGTARMTLGFPL